jgi:hypothetical protein
LGYSQDLTRREQQTDGRERRIFASVLDRAQNRGYNKLVNASCSFQINISRDAKDPDHACDSRRIGRRAVGDMDIPRTSDFIVP